MRLPLLLALAAFLLPDIAQATVCPSLDISSQVFVDTNPCTSVTGDVTISGQSIQNLDGLFGLTRVGGGILIQNTSIQHVDGLARLASVGGYLRIAYNRELTDLSGFGALTRVDNFLYLGFNDALTNVDGFTSLRSTGAFFISTNEQLENLDGFDALTSTDDLSINTNPNLTDIAGLRNVSQAGLLVTVFDNERLENVDGFSGLRYVEGSISIFQNAALRNVDGLAGLQSVGYGQDALVIYSNPVLERCALGVGPLLLAGDVLNERTRLQGNGTALVAPAVSDCNSEADILAAFLPTDAEAPADAEAARALAVYPNPAAGTATLAFAADGDAALVVYDALGREVARAFDGSASGTTEARFDAGALPAGLYVARLVADGRVETVRFSVLR